MTERRCCFPNCRTPLSEHVPLTIRLCGEHQLFVRKMKEGCPGLTEEDCLFVFSHKNGCSARQLAIYLKVAEDSVKSKIYKGLIKAVRDSNCHRPNQTWLIPQIEIARVIAWKRNWVNLRSLSSLAGIAPKTLYQYAREGNFGTIRPSFQGRLAIHRQELATLSQKCRTLKKINEKKRITPKKINHRNCYSIKKLTRLINAGRNTIYLWVRQNKITARKYGYELIITNDDIKLFLENVEQKKFVVHLKFARRLRNVISWPFI